MPTVRDLSTDSRPRRFRRPGSLAILALPAALGLEAGPVAPPAAPSASAATWGLWQYAVPEGKPVHGPSMQAWQLVQGRSFCQCAIYLALAPKSNASYMAIDAAMADVKEGRTVPVPVHIKDGNVRKASSLSAGDTPSARGPGYEYAHSEGIPTAPNGVGMVGTQDYLGVNKRYYLPTEFGAERLLKERLEEVRRLRGDGA